MPGSSGFETGTGACRATISITKPIRGKDAHVLTAMWAPDRSKPRHARVAARGSGMYIKPKRQVTASKSSEGVSAKSSVFIVRNSTFVMPKLRARAMAQPIMSGVISSPITRPRGPTTFAIANAGSPLPHATSSTELPAVMFASSISCCVTGEVSERSSSPAAQPLAAALHSSRWRARTSSIRRRFVDRSPIRCRRGLTPSHFTLPLRF